MGVLVRENIGALSKVNSTTVQLAPSEFYTGGRVFKNTNFVSCDLSTNGIGGLDVGSAAAFSLYYIYGVNDGVSSGLVCSLSSTGPSGFSAFTELGKMLTNDLSQVSDPVNFGKDFEKSYPIGTAPGTTLDGSETWAAAAYMDGDRVYGRMVEFTTRKRSVPTITAYDSNGVTGGNGRATFRTSGATEAVGLNAILGSESKFSFTCLTATLSGAFPNAAGAACGVAVGWTADAEIY